MTFRRAVLAAALFFVSSVAFADITGIWTGTMSGPVTCSGGATVTHTFNVELDLLQSGNLVSGSAKATGPNDPCIAGSPTITEVISVSGTVSGSSFTATDSDSDSFTATVSGSSMTLTVVFANGGHLSGTLSQTSTQPPATGFSGTYTGTYTQTVNAQSSNPNHPGCTNLTGSLTSSGDFIAVMSQVGGGGTMSATIKAAKDYADDGHGNCTVVTEDGTAVVTGTFNANVFTAPTFHENGDPEGTITVNFNGNSLSGTFVGDRSNGTFSGTRTTTTPSPFPPALVTSFTADPNPISAGTPATLSWTTINSSSVSIDNGIGTQPTSGSISVSPSSTTTYTLTATGPGGTATATETVTVSAAAPKIIVGSFPSGMLEPTGVSGTTDSFTVTNVGSASGDVTLSQSGNFFTLSPSSFTIPAASSQVVAIHAGAQPAGTYDGTVTINPGAITVPVHLLVAAPPTAPVIPQASQPRSDVFAPPGQNPSGSVSFTNSGAGTLTGIAVADVPWIVPQSGAITIAPGQSTQINFTIDRSKRPDASSVSGGLAGKLSLVYLNSASGKRAVSLGTTPTSSVSVTIVDVVRPAVASGSPAPLQSGEVAMFIEGLRGVARFNDDLAVSSRSSLPSISDLQLFLKGSGVSQVTTLPGFAPNLGVLLPGVRKNVFAFPGTAGGALQIRSGQAPSLALSEVLTLNGSNPAISSATALPILRSDRSIGPGERMTFTGAQDDLTTVYIQEVTGNPGHVSIEYHDANGAVIGNDSGDLGAFSAVASAGVAGTRSVVVINDGSAPSRLAAYAVVNDPTSGDGWILTDPQRQWGSASGALIVPLVQTSVASTTDLYVMNASASAAAVTLEVESGMRRHAVRGAGRSTQPLSIPPLTTVKSSLAGANGFVRLTGGGPSLSAVGRVTIAAGGATFGSSLPAVPESAALANGSGKRFTAVEDSSQKTIASRTPATYRSTLMLIETSGQSATVRVTLRYTFIAGATVSSQAISSRDFAVGPNQMLTIADLARSIIGAQRDAFGDLRNMQLDVDVIDGSGKVLSFLESIDNASGDIMVRAE